MKFHGYTTPVGRRVECDGKPLDPRCDLKNHSGGDFSWGYAGSGPGQLALAILAAIFDDSMALDLYQEFKWEIIAKLSQEAGWSMDEIDVSTWVSSKLREREIANGKN